MNLSQSSLILATVQHHQIRFPILHNFASCLCVRGQMSLYCLLFLNSIQQQQYDEKNIRRRVYDALNVLMAMDIISKDKKEIQWKGLPRTSVNDIEELKVPLQSASLISCTKHLNTFCCLYLPIQQCRQSVLDLEIGLKRKQHTCKSWRNRYEQLSLYTCCLFHMIRMVISSYSLHITCLNWRSRKILFGFMLLLANYF